jgi:hypothetical protein
MRLNIIVAASVGVALAGCGHNSDKAAKPPVAVETPAVKKGPDPVVPVTGNVAATSVFGLKGLGYNGTTPVALSGEVKTPDTGSSTIKGSNEPLSLSYTGDETLKGSLFTTARADRGGSSETRFLMSDQSINSKDIPTAFGLLVNKSSPTQFAAGALYGGKAPTNIPGSGTASYTGRFAGAANAGAANSGSQAALSGDFNLSADFSGGTVKGSVDKLTATQIDAAKPVGKGLDGITFNGTMDAGRAGYTATEITAAGLGVAKGKVEGGFYNASASETAGALTLSAGDANIVGAFQGTKQP